MGKTLVLAEKPSVARDLAGVLGARETGDGYFYNAQYIVTWAIGHLVTLAEPEAYDAAYRKWRFDTLPILPEKMKLEALPKTKGQLRVLRRLMNSKEVTDIICATDSGREGELIFRYLYEFTQCRKPFRRLWISSMTETAIREGFASLKDGREYELLYHSARCRAEADWLVGMNASRAYSLQYHALLSIGRVQTPTLAMMVQRQNEIDAFVPQAYFEVEAVFGCYRGIWLDEAEQTRIAGREEAERIAARTRGKAGSITRVETEEKKQLPPLLYDLTELQRACNRKFGFSAQQTLQIAQKLYESRKMITYPRTDSRYVSEDMADKMRSVLRRLTEAEPFAPFAQTVLAAGRLPLTKRIVDNSRVTDHHAILPTDGRITMASLTEEERKVFQLIAGRFLAVFYPPYLYEVTKVYTKVGEDTFLTKGKTVRQEGWLAVEQAMAPQPAKERTAEAPLPVLEEGRRVVAEETAVLAKQTKPPQPYTESMLLSAMEHAGRTIPDEALREQMKESGLGTPATRAAIIERLLKVGYIQRKGRTLIPTEKGQKLIAVVPEALRSAETTGKWEKGLAAIAKGTMSQTRFLESIRRYVCFLVQDAAERKQEITFDEPVRRSRTPAGKDLGVCPRCGQGRIRENSKAYACSQWKNGCTFTIWKNSTQPYGVTLDAAMVRRLLKGEWISPIAVRLPQTGEAAVAQLALSDDRSGRVELRNVTRTEKE